MVWLYHNIGNVQSDWEYPLYVIWDGVVPEVLAEMMFHISMNKTKIFGITS